MVVAAVERLWTYRDLSAFPDDDNLRREIIDGELLVGPSPNTRHQRLVGRFFAAFLVYLETYGGGEVFVAPLDVVFTPSDVVEPDVIFVADADASVVTAAHLTGPPTLAIEVMSDTRRDLVLKRHLYARCGVGEYWVVDPEADRIEVFLLDSQAGVYPEPVIYETGETLRPACLPGLAIDVERLLRR
ncbi:MAG: Uma2 family endonuclease [Acidimicrobiales bacterium]